jgi:hypothetical protein
MARSFYTNFNASLLTGWHPNVIERALLGTCSRQSCVRPGNDDVHTCVLACVHSSAIVCVTSGIGANLAASAVVAFVDTAAGSVVIVVTSLRCEPQPTFFFVVPVVQPIPNAYGQHWITRLSTFTFRPLVHCS